jgi:pimeloyl-ACP methyl ester carboxylesterase
LLLSRGFFRGFCISSDSKVEDRAMAPRDGYVTTQDGIRLYFRQLGDGPGTVIIPNAVHMFEDFKDLADDRTLIFFDLRNRGRSDAVSDRSKLERGVHHDVDDLEAVRRHFGLTRPDLLGHSMYGLMVALYAMKYPEHVNRVVQIGPAQPDFSKQYPAELTGADTVLEDVSAKLAKLDPSEAGYQDKWWALVRTLYVTDPADADKITLSAQGLPNELALLKHLNENLMPSLYGLKLTAEDFAKVKSPVLTIHGTRDRQAPYGGGQDWARLLPNARLVTVEGAAHAPWIENPEFVFGSIRAFLTPD